MAARPSFSHHQRVPYRALNWEVKSLRFTALRLLRFDDDDVESDFLRLHTAHRGGLGWLPFLLTCIGTFLAFIVVCAAVGSVAWAVWVFLPLITLILAVHAVVLWHLSRRRGDSVSYEEVCRCAVLQERSLALLCYVGLPLMLASIESMSKLFIDNELMQFRSLRFNGAFFTLSIIYALYGGPRLCFLLPSLPLWFGGTLFTIFYPFAVRERVPLPLLLVSSGFVVTPITAAALKEFSARKSFAAAVRVILATKRADAEVAQRTATAEALLPASALIKLLAQPFSALECENCTVLVARVCPRRCPTAVGCCVADWAEAATAFAHRLATVLEEMAPAASLRVLPSHGDTFHAFACPSRRCPQTTATVCRVALEFAAVAVTIARDTFRVFPDGARPLACGIHCGPATLCTANAQLAPDVLGGTFKVCDAAATAAELSPVGVTVSWALWATATEEHRRAARRAARHKGKATLCEVTFEPGPVLFFTPRPKGPQHSTASFHATGLAHRTADPRAAVATVDAFSPAVPALHPAVTAPLRGGFLFQDPELRRHPSVLWRDVIAEFDLLVAQFTLCPKRLGPVELEWRFPPALEDLFRRSASKGDSLLGTFFPAALVLAITVTATVEGWSEFPFVVPRVFALVGASLTVVGAGLHRLRRHSALLDWGCLVVPFMCIWTYFSAVDYHRTLLSADPVAGRIFLTLCVATYTRPQPWYFGFAADTVVALLPALLFVLMDHIDPRATTPPLAVLAPYIAVAMCLLYSFLIAVFLRIHERTRRTTFIHEHCLRRQFAASRLELRAINAVVHALLPPSAVTVWENASVGLFRGPLPGPVALSVSDAALVLLLGMPAPERAPLATPVDVADQFAALNQAIDVVVAGPGKCDRLRTSGDVVFVVRTAASGSPDLDASDLVRVAFSLSSVVERHLAVAPTLALHRGRVAVAAVGGAAPAVRALGPAVDAALGVLRAAAGLGCTGIFATQQCIEVAAQAPPAAWVLHQGHTMLSVGPPLTWRVRPEPLVVSLLTETDPDRAVAYEYANLLTWVDDLD